jgi:type I restriction enzyme S subunit
MINKYEAYKDSGVEWIGVIPLSWGNVRLKLISSITKGRKPSKDFEEFQDGLLPYLSMEYLRNKTNTPIYADSNESNIVLVEEGDILILWDGSKSGEIVRAKKGVLSSTMAKIEIYDERFESNYLNYLLQLGEKHIQNNTIGMGIPHVNGNILKDLAMLLPSNQEQTQIAAYLNYQTGLIDAIIEKKELLIQKLKEQRQAIINEAVTKGLNPNVPMKNSGIEWLGEIPAPWEVVKLKFLGESITGITYSPADVKENGLLVLRSSNIQNGELSLNDTVYVQKEVNQKYIVQLGDILLCSRNGSRNLIGKNIMIDQRVANQTWGAFMTIFRSEFNDFLYFFFNSDIFTALSSLFLSSTINQLTIGVLNNMQIAFPKNEEERKSIIEFLTISNKKINGSINLLEIQIQKLKSYRQAIISEAVTGKIDVRDWVKTKEN